MRMRRLVFAALVIALAAAVHVDWHLARPSHHRLSLGWDQHWLFAALVFGLAGWIVARTWPEQTWRPGAVIVTLALILAQGIEPMAEVALYLHRLGYPDEPARWAAFFVCVAIGLPVYCLAVWRCRPNRDGRASDSLAPAA
jgi:FtsH-binding integral membrane protein